MPIIASLIGALSTAAGSLVGRVLLALGMGFVTFKGADVSISWILDFIKQSLSAMPVQVVNFFAFLWIDKALSMVFSAYTTAAFIRMAGGTSLTKLITKS